MKKVFILISIISAFFLGSCDNRKSKTDRIKDAVKVFNKKNRLLNTTAYYPDNYTETKTDSIISKTFHVAISNYSLMTDDIVIKKIAKGKQQNTTVHRVFESSIIVSVHHEIIYDKHISAKTFNYYEPSEFWDNATLEHVWVHQEHSNAENLSLRVSFINPKNNMFKLYEIRIDRFGNEQLQVLKNYS